MTAFPVAPTRRPGRVGFWIGGVLILLAAIGGIGSLVLGLTRGDDAIEGFQRVPLGKGGTFVFRDTGSYAVYLERPGINEPDQDHAIPGLQAIALYRETTVVRLRPAGSTSVTYSTLGNHDGRRLGHFQIDQPGSYHFLGADSAVPGDELAVGQGETGGLVYALGIFAALGGGFVGFIIVIVSAVRFSGSARPPVVYAGGPGPGWGPSPSGGRHGAPASAPAPPVSGTPPGWAPPGP
ncbi:MAG: hypothetical protein JWM47_499, partial [Acidimicrobiales bacterium]|nr:hypothetical protein [Acidimicrobiales bacterium]